MLPAWSTAWQAGSAEGRLAGSHSGLQAGGSRGLGAPFPSPGPPMSLWSLSAGPTAYRPPSSRLRSPTAPPGKSRGATGGGARSECISPTRPNGIQRSATGSAAAHVSRQDGQPRDSRKSQAGPGRGDAGGLGPGGRGQPAEGVPDLASPEDIRVTFQDQVEGPRSSRSVLKWVAPGNSWPALKAFLLPKVPTCHPAHLELAPGPLKSLPAPPPPGPTGAGEGGKAPEASSSQTHEGRPG